MRLLLQRVRQARVRVDGRTVGEIGGGILVLLGIASTDTERELTWCVDKLIHLRIFPDEEGKMNLSLKESGGSILLVSQFTLYGDLRRGRRPGFSAAAPPEIAEPLYLRFAEALRREAIPVETGIFGAMMDVELINEGPVTLLLEKEADSCVSR